MDVTMILIFMKYPYGGTPNTLCQTQGVDGMMYFIIVPRNCLEDIFWAAQGYQFPHKD